MSALWGFGSGFSSASLGDLASAHLPRLTHIRSLTNEMNVVEYPAHNAISHFVLVPSTSRISCVRHWGYRAPEGLPN